MERPQAAAAGGSTASRVLPVFVPLGKPFQELFGIARSTQAELIRKRELRSVLVGDVRGRRMIEVQSWLEYVERQQRREAAGQIGVNSPNPHARQRQAAAAPTSDAKSAQPTRPEATTARPVRERKTRRIRRRAR